MSRRGTANRPAPRMPASSSGLAPQVGSLTGGAPPTPAPATAPAPVAETPTHEQPPAPVPGEPPAPAPRTPAAKPRSGRRANGTTRSWYLPHDVADELSEACDEIYHDLRGRQDKSEILGALIRLGLNNSERVRKKFGLPPSSN